MSKHRPLVFGTADMLHEDVYLAARRHEGLLHPSEIAVLERASRVLQESPTPAIKMPTGPHFFLHPARAQPQ